MLFYYAEKTGSFAMTGRDGTALRSLAALTQVKKRVVLCAILY